MKKHIGKIMTVLVLGSIWGAMEIFGVEFLKAMAVPYKSPFLLAFALAVMMAGKRLSDFAGSAILMAIIAAFYKTMSFSLPACGSNVFAAVIIDGAVFEAVYQLSKSRIESSLWQRSLAGAAMAFGALFFFGLYAAFINPESAAASGNITGAFDYLRTRGIFAVAMSLAAINIGFYLGNATKAGITSGSLSKANLFKASGMVFIVIAWAARFTAGA